MAWELPVLDLSLEAGADLSAKQFYLVKLDSSGRVVLAGAAERAIGVLQNKPLAGEAAQVRVLGVSKVISGYSFGVGTVLASDSAGKAVASSSAKPIGISLEAAGAANQIVSVLVIPGWETL